MKNDKIHFNALCVCMYMFVKLVGKVQLFVVQSLKLSSSEPG